MLRRTLVAMDLAAPVIMGASKHARSLGSANREVTGRPAWAARNFLPLDMKFGWQMGNLPKYHARTDFHRQMLARRMATQLVNKDYLIVAGAKGPALRIIADMIVDMCKKGDTDSRQALANFLNDPLLVDKAFDEYPRRFKDMNGKYAMMTKLRTRRRVDNIPMYLVEFKNRDLSESHKGEDFSAGPERFFLPARVIETERGVQRPPHLQMSFDRWASKFKTEEFTHWWRLRHAKMRYWGIRGVPHPLDVDPLWSEKEEEEWHNEMMQNSSMDEDIDLDSDEYSATGEGGRN